MSMLSTQLMDKYGRSFALRNLRRMMQFAEQFPDFQIVSPLATQLSWAHIIEVLPLKTHDAKLYYLKESSRNLLGKRELREMISRKAYERKEIADTQISKFKSIGTRGARGRRCRSTLPVYAVPTTPNATT